MKKGVKNLEIKSLFYDDETKRVEQGRLGENQIWNTEVVMVKSDLGLSAWTYNTPATTKMNYSLFDQFPTPTFIIIHWSPPPISGQRSSKSVFS